MPSVAARVRAPSSASGPPHPGFRQMRSVSPTSSRAEDVADEEVEKLDEDERGDDPPQAVDEEVAAKEGGGADRPVLDAAEREGDERRDDERVEDDRRD